ncbi:MAG: hypothetical protein A2139_00790, partial [Desulfobacca sp. RBG_16_60_12]
MANILLAAALLSGILAVSGCVGPYPGNGAYGYGGGEGYASYGGGQSNPYDAGIGGGYGQPVQPYYQPQPYAVYDNTVVYANQPVQQATGRYEAAAAPGRWLDRRQQHQEERIQRGQASGQLTPREARRLQMEQGRIRGAEGRMRADGNLNPQERGRLNAMQQKSSQDIYRQRHNGVQPGAAAPSRPTGPARPLAQVHPAGQPRAAAQPQAAAQPRGADQPR